MQIPDLMGVRKSNFSGCKLDTSLYILPKAVGASVCSK